MIEAPRQDLLKLDIVEKSFVEHIGKWVVDFPGARMPNDVVLSGYQSTQDENQLEFKVCLENIKLGPYRVWFS